MLSTAFRLLAATAMLLAAPASGSLADKTPIIDAHNQSDQYISYDEILALMDQAKVARVILTQRGKIWPEALAKFALRHPDRITAAVRAAGGHYVKNRLDKYDRFITRQARMSEFRAMGEVIMWHAEKKNVKITASGKRESAPQIVVHPDDRRVKTALRLALERKWPFIVHIEFAAAGADRDVFMTKLEDLLRANPAHPFALIHMGQLKAKDVRRLIEAHPNIHFITSHTTPIFTKSVQPWVIMFEGKSLAPQWKSLMTRHPDRFILGIDNVLARNWRNSYVQQVRLWRRALKELPDDVAHAVAHRNAERLWRLPPAR